MISSYINTALSGQGNFGAYDELRQQRLAEAALRDKVRQAASGLEQGSTLQVNTNYAVGRNGALNLVDATITANARGQAAIQPKQEEAQQQTLDTRQQNRRTPTSFADFAKPGFNLSPIEQLEIFNNGSKPIVSPLNATSSKQEFVFTRGTDGVYYATADEIATSTPKDLGRTARESINLLNITPSDQNARQAQYDVSRLYAANTISLLFPEGELQAVA